MKIRLVNEYFYPDDTGGTGTLIAELARYLVDNYDDVDLSVLTSTNIYRNESTSVPLYEDWNGVKIHRVRVPRTKRPSLPLRLAAGIWFAEVARRKLHKMQPCDLVIGVTNPPALPIAVQKYARRENVPFIYLLHDLYPDLPVALRKLSEDGAATRFCRKAQRDCLLSSTKVAVCGESMKNYLMENYDVPEGRIVLAPNWADTEKTVPASKDTPFRNEHQLKGFVVLFAGNIGEHIDFEPILDAASILKKSGDVVTFAFVGNGTKRDSIQSRIESEGLGNVRLLGVVPQERMPEVLASSDACLVPFPEELDGLGVPSKTYGIMAAGRAMVSLASPRSEAAIMVRDGKCGVNIPNCTGNALAHKLRELARDPEAVERMGENGRHFVKRRYVLPIVADRLHRTFQTAIARS